MKEVRLSREWKINPVAGEAVKVTSPAPREQWDEISSEDPNTLISQTPEWIDCVCQSGPYQDASRLYELPNGRRIILPMVKRSRFLPGLSVLESPPYGWGIGGMLAPGGVNSQDIAVVLAELSQQPFLYAAIRPNPMDGARWDSLNLERMVKIPRLAHVLDLKDGFDKVWSQQFKSAARQNVRRAEKSGLVVERDTTGRLVPAFYSLFQQSIERWASQQHEPIFLARWRNMSRDPMKKFQSIVEKLGENSRLWVAFLNGRPVAGILVLQGANAYYTRGAMDKELAGPTRANDLLHSLAIEEACRSGCRYYHMGETGMSTDLARFKERFGSQAYPYAEYRIERLPMTQIDHSIRKFVKRMIRFRDV